VISQFPDMFSGGQPSDVAPLCLMCAELPELQFRDRRWLSLGSVRTPVWPYLLLGSPVAQNLSDYFGKPSRGIRIRCTRCRGTRVRRVSPSPVPVLRPSNHPRIKRRKFFEGTSLLARQLSRPGTNTV